ncbi:recombinase family protein [Pseudomonas asiatica]
MRLTAWFSVNSRRSAGAFHAVLRPESASVGMKAENISGTKLNRPELVRLLDAAEKGEVLLVESVDRLSCLSPADGDTLKSTIKGKGLRLVIADLPTSWEMVNSGVTGEVMRVINDMLIDLMATMARLDQEKRVERIRQGLKNKRAAEPEWKPTGKGRNRVKWEKVADLLKRNGNTVDEIAKIADVGIATVYRIKRELTL